MLIDNKFFSKKVLLFDKDLKDKDEVLDLLSDVLESKGIVKDSFRDAIKKREENYPTGLALASGIGVAIPHTDSEHINENQVGFVSLKNPIDFKQMGSDTEIVSVKLVFVLCLKESHKQLDMLQNLMGLFSNDEIIEKFVLCKNKNEFINIINE